MVQNSVRILITSIGEIAVCIGKENRRQPAVTRVGELVTGCFSEIVRLCLREQSALARPNELSALASGDNA
jgi:hypothetical protein